MKGLLFETSEETGVAALTMNGRLLSFKMLNGGSQLSKTLASEAGTLTQAFRPDYIGIGTGPGSYTGIRVGASLAKALAFGWKIPLFGFCSLKAFSTDPFVPVLVDARTGGFYVLKYLDAEPLLLSPAQAQMELQHCSELASPHPCLIQKRLSLPVRWIETSPNLPLLSQLVFNQFLAMDLKPLHLYPK